jgi:hypothetical protein
MPLKDLPGAFKRLIPNICDHFWLTNKISPSGESDMYPNGAFSVNDSSSGVPANACVFFDLTFL